MSEEKKEYYTEAQAAASRKYLAKYMFERVRVTSERHDKIKAHAEKRDESVNAFINRAIDTQIELDTLLERRTKQANGGA